MTRHRMRAAGVALLAAGVAGLAGCATVVGDVRPFAETPGPVRGYAVASPSIQAAPGGATGYAAPAGDGGGSIFAATGSGGASRGLRLFEDGKARHVGDLLTIVLVERTRATTTAETSVKKDSGIDIAAPTVFGREVTYKGAPLLQAAVEGGRDFAGSGDSAQSNRLDGNITVSVVEQLGNGNLRVAGEKRIRLNQGDELVQFQGIVRTADIGHDNRIASDRVGEARIVYGGRGTLARSNAMGWLGRFFNSAAFPY